MLRETPMPKPERQPYIVHSVVHASRILDAFQAAGEALRLRDVVERTGLGKGMCFRLLHTLHHCGLLERGDASRYRLVSPIQRRKRYRLGYGAQGQDTSFAREVRGSLERAAEREGAELIVVDNRYQPKVAVRNAEHLIREGVDLVIEFQTDEAVAAAIAAKYLEAGIPLVAIEIPHPRAPHFGANNYHAGPIAGPHLGHFARTRWEGKVEEILLLDLARAGSLVRARMSGVRAGLAETLHDDALASRLVSLDGDGQFKTSLEKVRRHLRQSKARRGLGGGAHHPSAPGAAPGLPGAGPAASCPVAGPNPGPAAPPALPGPPTPPPAPPGASPRRYGDGLLKLALDILSHRQTPPALFVRHQLVTTENVDHLYPNDALLGHVSSASSL